MKRQLTESESGSDWAADDKKERKKAKKLVRRRLLMTPRHEGLATPPSSNVAISRRGHVSTEAVEISSTRRRPILNSESPSPSLRPTANRRQAQVEPVRSPVAPKNDRKDIHGTPASEYHSHGRRKEHKTLKKKSPEFTRLAFRGFSAKSNGFNSLNNGFVAGAWLSSRPIPDCLEPTNLRFIKEANYHAGNKRGRPSPFVSLSMK